jgi:hypothetical protein
VRLKLKSRFQIFPIVCPPHVINMKLELYSFLLCSILSTSCFASISSSTIVEAATTTSEESSHLRKRKTQQDISCSIPKVRSIAVRYVLGKSNPTLFSSGILIYIHQSILYMHYHILEHYNCVVSANSGLGKLHCPSIRHCRIDRRSFR